MHVVLDFLDLLATVFPVHKLFRRDIRTILLVALLLLLLVYWWI